MPYMHPLQLKASTPTNTKPYILQVLTTKGLYLMKFQRVKPKTISPTIVDVPLKILRKYSLFRVAKKWFKGNS
jgi:hypothetical protein